MSDSRPDVPAVAVRSVALPVEHGGWGMLFEPLLLGLVLAPSPAGLGLGVAALGAFLARHPLKLALADRRRGSRYPRTALAERFALLYAALALAGLTLALRSAAPFCLLPLAAAAPLALVQLAYDSRHQGRQVWPELAGGIAVASIAAAVTLAGGWAAGPALALWLILAARAGASVVYVRARLRAARGLRPDLTPTWLCHAGCVALAVLLALRRLTPWSAVAAFVALLARALYGLAPSRKAVRPQVVGFQELGFGTLTVLLLALGYGLGL